MPLVTLGAGSCASSFSTHSLARTTYRSGRVGARRVSALRRAYFAQGFETATRFGIAFDELVVHLWNTREQAGPVDLLSCKHVADVIFAIACLKGSPSAWSLFFDRYERTLIRQATASYQESQATVIVRRMISELRFELPHITGGRPISLRSYTGRRSLRAWLGERLGYRLRASCTRFTPLPEPPRVLSLHS
ncbi:MAG TPA: hypothetical protein VG711_01470 [Phycisphaerales bacterium]|nr:hypothetical protein [Phycisphaerales bacterium]